MTRTSGLIYFAHPVPTYGTDLERRAIDELLGDGWDVLNPNDPVHEAGYAAKGMAYFLDLLATCEALAWMPMSGAEDGSDIITAGVAREVLEAKLQGMPIIKLAGHGGFIVPGHGFDLDDVLTIEQTRSVIAAHREKMAA